MHDRPVTAPFFPEQNDCVSTIFSWDALPHDDPHFVSLKTASGDFLTPGSLTALHGPRSDSVMGHIKGHLARQGTLGRFSIKACDMIVPIPPDLTLTKLTDRIDALKGPVIALKRLKAKAVREIMGLCTEPPATSAGFLDSVLKDPGGFFSRFLAAPEYTGVQCVYWDVPGSMFGAGLPPFERFGVATVRPGFLCTLRTVVPPRSLLSERARWNKELCLEELRDKFIVE